jgi:myosin heavy subunit
VKTVRNDNSSRFGKFTEVQFNSGGILAGMRVTPFLLERSRVVTCGADERVFHCFYQLVAGATGELRSKLRLRQARDFALLSRGNCVSLKNSGVDDAKDFFAVCNALRQLNFTDDEQLTMWRCLAAILHLQNVTFSAHPKDGSARIDEAHLETVRFVAEELLEIRAEDFSGSLLTSTSAIKHESVTKNLSAQKASDQRDALCKFIYSRLFLWITAKVNAATADGAVDDGGRPLSPEGATGASWIALLDIFGFEDFQQNSFEQFCINLANEALQRHYTRHHFIQDMENMRNEGISTKDVSFRDNLPCLELIQGTKNSVISLLDDCSALDLERAASDPNMTFLSKVTSVHRPEYQQSAGKGGKSVLDRSEPMTKPSDFFFRGRLDDDTFTIRHFACDVKYKVQGFVEKNNESLRESSLATLLDTSNEVLRQIFETRTTMWAC